MSRRNIYIIVGVVLVLLVVAYWFLLLDPMRGNIESVEAQILTEQSTLAQNQARLAQLEQTRVEGQRNLGRMVELAKMVPARTELPSLLLQIQDLATEAGIEFMTISPGAPTAAGLYEYVTLGLQFEGTFFDVNDFIYRAEQMAAGPGRVLSVKTLSLSPMSEDLAKPSPRLTVSMTVNAYQRTAPENLVPAQ